MNKGLFSIPLYGQDVSMSKIAEEITHQVVSADNWGLDEAYFGEHLADKHEKITSSLIFISSLSKITKKIKLGTLTTNLNFYNPAVIASIISMVDNLCNGRLMLGVGSGANMSDLESIESLEKNNHALSLEILKIIQDLFLSENLVNIKSENFVISTQKYGDETLGLGYFNKLYNNRNNLEILMPALNKDSYNVKLCARNKWSIVISNFCSEEIIENHISNYLKNSPLKEEDALKKIKVSKLIFVSEESSLAKKMVFADNSPFMEVVKIIFNKLKKFNKHSCFGTRIETPMDAARSIIIYGDPEKVSNEIKKKYQGLSSIIYVTVPMSNNNNYNKSLELFSKNVSV